MQHDTAIFGARLRQHRILARLRPVEGAAIDDGAADRIAVAADEFGQRMHDDIGAVFDRPHQIGRGQRVVDDQRQAMLAGDVADLLDVDEDAARIGETFDEDRLGLVVDLALEGRRIICFGPADFPAEVLEGMAELVDRAAIKLVGGDEVVAGLHQIVEDEHLRGVAGGDGKGRGAALERGDAFLEHRLRRVHDARVDVAEGLQPEQRRGMVGVIEDIGGGLVDRRGARAGRRIRLGAGMDGERVETGRTGHGNLPQVI